MSNFYRPLARPGGSSDRLVLTAVSSHEGAVLSGRSKVRVQVVQLGASPIRLVGVWLAGLSRIGRRTAKPGQIQDQAHEVVIVPGRPFFRRRQREEWTEVHAYLQLSACRDEPIHVGKLIRRIADAC